MPHPHPVREKPPRRLSAFRFSETERDGLAQIAAARDTTMTDALRQMIDENKP